MGGLAVGFSVGLSSLFWQRIITLSLSLSGLYVGYLLQIQFHMYIYRLGSAVLVFSVGLCLNSFTVEWLKTVRTFTSNSVESISLSGRFLLCAYIIHTFSIIIISDYACYEFTLCLSGIATYVIEVTGI